MPQTAAGDVSEHGSASERRLPVEFEDWDEVGGRAGRGSEGGGTEGGIAADQLVEFQPIESTQAAESGLAVIAGTTEEMLMAHRVVVSFESVTPFAILCVEARAPQK